MGLFGHKTETMQDELDSLKRKGLISPGQKATHFKSEEDIYKKDVGFSGTNTGRIEKDPFKPDESSIAEKSESGVTYAGKNEMPEEDAAGSEWNIKGLAVNAAAPREDDSEAAQSDGKEQAEKEKVKQLRDWALAASFLSFFVLTIINIVLRNQDEDGLGFDAGGLGSIVILIFLGVWLFGLYADARTGEWNQDHPDDQIYRGRKDYSVYDGPHPDTEEDKERSDKADEALKAAEAMRNSKY